MPKGDRTGPAGAGPRSGRGAGLCSGFNMPGYTKSEMVGHSGRARGYRRHWGGTAAVSRGGRNRCFAPDRPNPMYSGSYPEPAQFSSPASEKNSLKNRSRIIQSELNEINARLEKIEEQGA